MSVIGTKLALTASKKIAEMAIKDPEKGSRALIAIIMGVISFFLLIAMIAGGMISGFIGDQTINGDFDAQGLDTYIKIFDARKDHEISVQEEFKEIEEDLIDEYTEIVEVEVTYIDEKTGKEYIKIEEKEICTVDITKTMSATDCASYFAFINHNPSYNVKDGKKKEIIHKEVLDFYNDISKTIIKVTKEPVKETEDAPRKNGTVEIYNEIS